MLKHMFGLVYRHWAWVNSHSCLFCCKKYYKALHASRSPRSVWLKPYFAPCSICLPFIQRPQFLCHSPKIWNSLLLSKRVPLLIPHLKMHLKTSKPSSSHNPSFGFCWPLCAFVIFTYLFTKHTQPFNGLLSGTTWVGRYHKKHSPTHTHPDDRTSFIIFLHLQRSMASSLFSLRAWLKSKYRIQYSDATGVEISSYDVNGASARRWASCGSIVVESIHAALPYIKRSHPTSMPRPALSVVARSVSMLVVGSCKHRRRPTDRAPANNSTTDAAAAAITFITAPFHRSLAQ